MEVIMSGLYNVCSHTRVVKGVRRSSTFYRHSVWHISPFISPSLIFSSCFFSLLSAMSMKDAAVEAFATAISAAAGGGWRDACWSHSQHPASGHHGRHEHDFQG